MAGRRGSTRRASSSFGSFLAGLTIGLIVALVVYLNPRPDPLRSKYALSRPQRSAEPATSATKKKSAERSISDKADGERDTKYDFYSILPEAEGESPDRSARTRRSAASPAAKPTTAGRAESPGRTSVAGTGSAQAVDKPRGPSAETGSPAPPELRSPEADDKSRRTCPPGERCWWSLQARPA